MADPRRARRSLLVFFAVLIPVSGFIDLLIVRRYRGISPELRVFLLMWAPALASVVARLALREGFGDLSLRLGPRGVRAILLAAAFPLAVCALAYGLAWSAGLAEFKPPSDDSPLLWPSTMHAISGPPWARFARLVAVHATIGTMSEMIWSAGEEIGWRGYFVQRLIDAKIPMAIPLSGLVWGMWHWPLALAAASHGGLHTARMLGLFTIMTVIVGSAMARQRLETGSLWPAIVLHSAWNDVMAMAFGASTPDEGIWLGEGGILVVAACALLVAPFVRGRWKARRAPKEEPYGEVGLVGIARVSRG